MSEFRVVKKADVPSARRGPPKRLPQARLQKSGTLILSVAAVEALGSRSCPLMVQFDEAAMVLKLTAVDQPPRGLTEADLFNLTVKAGKRMSRPLGILYLKPLLRYIGYRMNGSQSFSITTDPGNRSISLMLPAEMFCDGSLN